MDSPTLAEGWHLPGAAAPVPREGVGGEVRGAEGDKLPFLAGVPASCSGARAVREHIPPTAGVALL